MIKIKEINLVWRAIKDMARTWDKVSNSAREIAPKVVWDASIKDIETRVTTAIATLAVTHRKSSRNFLFDDAMRLYGWTNLQTGERRMSRPYRDDLQPLAFTTVHVIDPAIFPLITQEGKFSIIDTYLDLARDHDIRGYVHDQDIVVDVGRPESITEAERYFL
jgi:hypothetical protein